MLLSTAHLPACTSPLLFICSCVRLPLTREKVRHTAVRLRCVDWLGARVRFHRHFVKRCHFACAQHDADPSTRRSSGRRRSKRRSPQTLLYEEQYAPLLARKRGRRVATRTPTPVCDLPREKSDLGTSNPNSPGSDAGPAANEGKGVPPSVSAAQTAKSAAARSPQSDYAANKRKGRARKRAAGRPCPPSALNIAIQNSLLESNKPAGGYRSSKGRKVSKPNRSASSSRSSSPAAEVLSNKAPSPTGSSASSAASNDAYASSHSPSTSPAEFGFLPSSFESRSTSTNESSLRGLMDGVMPESEAVFLKNLYDFMSNRNTPIGRIPSLGFKKCKYRFCEMPLH